MIEPIGDGTTWNQFVATCQPNTFLHSWEWGQVQKATGEGVQYLGLFTTSNELTGVALVIMVNARRGRHYLIPHGPLVKNQDHYGAALTELTSYLRNMAKRDRVVGLRISPLLADTPSAQSLFHQLGFRPAPIHVHAEITWVLDISAYPEALLAGMRKTTRHAIHKAKQAGVTCDIISDPQEALRRFWPLYQQTRRRHSFVLWPKATIEKQLEIFSFSQRIFSVVARHNNSDIAAAIIPHFGHTAYYYHGASAKLSSAIPAAQLLQWTAILEARRRGATHYNFWGIAPTERSEGGPPKLWRRRAHPFAGLTTFKQGFGGRAINYLHAQDLPFSLGYWLLFTVDTYRKFRRGF